MSEASSSCVAEPVSWLRLERYHLGELPSAEHDVIAVHLAACPACGACLARIEADDAVALPPLTLPAKTPRPASWRRWSERTSSAVAFAALAASVWIAVARMPVTARALPDASGARTKGGGIAFALVRDDGQRLDDIEGTFRDGDRFKAVVTCPAWPADPQSPGPYFDVVVFDREGATFPLEPRALACGNEVPLPGAFRLVGRSHESVCLVWSDDGPIDRSRVARADRAVFPSASCKELDPAGP